MTQYIDKAAVVAEIEREKAYAQTMGDNAINSSMQQFYDGMKEGCNSMLLRAAVESDCLLTTKTQKICLKRQQYGK